MRSHGRLSWPNQYLCPLKLDLCLIESTVVAQAEHINLPLRQMADVASHDMWIVGLSRVLSNERVTEAIARFITDVRMHEPSPQKTFADWAYLLHYTRGRARRLLSTRLSFASQQSSLRWLPSLNGVPGSSPSPVTDHTAGADCG
jgi:hypothetical protein